MDTVVIQAGDEGILSGGILGGITAEKGVNMVFGDEPFVAEDERVPPRRLAREHGVDPGLLEVNRVWPRIRT